MELPKWTEERTASLTGFVGSESPISQATVAAAAEELETSTRSVSSKLRKMGYDSNLLPQYLTELLLMNKKQLFINSLLTILVSTLMQK